MLQKVIGLFEIVFVKLETYAFLNFILCVSYCLLTTSNNVPTLYHIIQCTYPRTETWPIAQLFRTFPPPPFLAVLLLVYLILSLTFLAMMCLRQLQKRTILCTRNLKASTYLTDTVKSQKRKSKRVNYNIMSFLCLCVSS